MFAPRDPLGMVLHEMVTGEIPYEGLGGRAGLPDFRVELERALRPASDFIPGRRRWPIRALIAIDDFLSVSLALNPDDRFATRSVWLDAADVLHDQFRPRRRLGPLGR